MSDIEKPKDEEVPVVIPHPEEDSQPVHVSLVGEEKVEEVPAPVKLVEEATESAVKEAPAEPAKAEPASAEPKPGVLKWLFDPSTGRGRFMRTFARWTAIVIGLFALGFLVAYFALYQPAAQQLEDSRAENVSLTAQLKTTQDQMVDLQGDLTDSKGLLLQAQNGQSETQAELTQMTTQRRVLEILYDVTAARLAWMTNDQVVALTLLVNADAMLYDVRPDIQAKDAKLADFVEEQLQNTIAGIKSNAPSIPNSLEKLNRTVQTLERLFGILSQ